MYRLVTTLLNPRVAPALKLIELYHERWEVELVLDEVKTHERVYRKVLRSKTPEGVRQELYGLVLAHYAVRSLMLRAADSRGLDPDRISFTAAIQILGQALPQSVLLSPQQAVATLKRIYADLTCPGQLVAPRRLRFNSRVVKHICTRFRRKRPEHHFLTFKHLSFSDILLI